MATFFSRFSPIPAFPPYTGPYDVGTLEVEIPVEELPSHAPAPSPTIPTISFRIFYPCETPIKPPKPAYWLPDPQRAYFAAYIRFLGASRKLSGILQ
jgi:platelet-activating factor acetylhydrolase